MMTANSLRSKGQVYSVGNYLMTGKVLGKGHFARVEEATHRVIGKKVAIKIIDLTSIKEEYARRNLHREPRVMAKLRHPCIAALYETLMHGPRLYVVMEAAGGGDLCAHVLAARGPARGLPEVRARALAAQLVSAVRHMHVRGVVHRDLKMENIMLDSTKQFIKIVDFGLSNLWSSGGALRTPCGSLEYAAPELFVDGRRYGPEVDLWSIGVIVYGMVTGGLPFTGAEGGEGRSRPLLRAAIARGFTKKQRAALACVSNECKAFIQHLLEPNVELRMKIEEAARHRWVKRPGMKMKAHPFGVTEPKLNREIYRQISELSGHSVMDVVAQIKAEPFGPIAGIYNIKTHLHQLQAVPGVDLLWSSIALEPRPATPPEYKSGDVRPETAPSCSKSIPTILPPKPYTPPPQKYKPQKTESSVTATKPTTKSITPTNPQKLAISVDPKNLKNEILRSRNQSAQSPRFSAVSRPLSSSFGKTFKYDSGDCRLDARLPSIDEHSNTDLNDKKIARAKAKVPFTRKVNLDEERRLNSCPNKVGERRLEFYRRAGDGLPSNIVSPHSSSNSHCKSERAMPVSWYPRNQSMKESPHLQRFRRTAPMK